MTEWEHALLGIYTTRCTGGDGAGLDRFLPPQRTTRHGYGRQALVEALRRLEIGPGDAVLLPGFICREVLASLTAVGALPRFYDINERLETDLAALERTDEKLVRAVVAVNYFGFPQPLEPFREWCGARNAALIEDNAHGFLSAEGDVPLGRRGDLGLFSLRKTLPVPNGGALVDNRAEPTVKPDESLAREGSPWLSQERYRLKMVAKRAIGAAGLGCARASLTIFRKARALARSEAADAARADPETAMPQEAWAPMTTRLLRRLDIVSERSRRRMLYERFSVELTSEPDVRPLCRDLPDGVVPQGFPFLFTGRDPEDLIARWWRRGIQIVRWPDLPASIEAQAPPHYRRMMLAPFLW